jgi:hypothetical protein
MNKYAPHVYVIPEDDADRQLADGFVLHHKVKTARIQVMPLARGWRNVLNTFQEEYVQTLRNYPQAHVVMLIDFDGRVDERRAEFELAIPDDLKVRVFVVGSKDRPETLKKALKISFEQIGESLANDCDAGNSEHWDHEELRHNEAERMVQNVKPFLFWRSGN